MTAAADLAAAVAWLQRSRDSKSPSVAQSHAATILKHLEEAEARVVFLETQLDVESLKREAAERKLDAQSSMDRAYGFKARAEAAEAKVDRLTSRGIEDLRFSLEAAEAERDEAREAKRGWCRLYSQDITAARARVAELEQARTEAVRCIERFVANTWNARDDKDLMDALASLQSGGIAKFIGRIDSLGGTA